MLAVHCRLNSFQLLNIKFPDKFDAAIQLTEVTRQQIDTALQQQQQGTIPIMQLIIIDKITHLSICFNTALIEAETQVAASVQQAIVIRTKAMTERQAALTQGNAEAEAILSRATNLVEGYQSIMQNVSFNAAELLAYHWIQSLANTGAKLTFNIEKPSEVTY